MNLLTDTFFSDLEQLYKKDDNLSEYWKHEESELKQLVPLVAERIAFNYKIEKPIGVGGSGIVAIVHDINLGLKRALKIARPSPGKKKLLARLLEAEAASLLRLSHRNLIQIFANVWGQASRVHIDRNHSR